MDKKYSLQKGFRRGMNRNFLKSIKLLNDKHPLEVKGAFSEFSRRGSEDCICLVELSTFKLFFFVSNSQNITLIFLTIYCVRIFKNNLQLLVYKILGHVREISLRNNIKKSKKKFRTIKIVLPNFSYHRKAI